MRPTRVAAYVQENGASCCLRFLEAVVSMLCSLLLLCGVTAACFSAVFIYDSRQSTLSHALGSGPFGQPSASELWYLYALGAVGLAATLTSAVGLWAVGRRSIWLLNIQLVMLSLLLSGQLVIVGLSLASHTGPGFASLHQSAHTYGQPAQLLRLLLAPDGGLSSRPVGVEVEGESLQSTHQLSAVHLNKQLALLVVGSVGLGLQVFTLMFSCVLQSTYSQIDEAAQDAAEEATERRPLLPSQIPTRHAANRAAMPEDAATVEWRTRMQERYGIDTRQFTYDPAAASRQDMPPELGPSGSQASSSRCTIM